MPAPLGLADLSEATPGVLPNQLLAEAVTAGWIEAGEFDPSSIQPASLDLHLGDIAYSIQCSFLPDAEGVEAKLKAVDHKRHSIKGGLVLHRNQPYLIPLRERLSLPTFMRARANPKSSTGRVDVFTRVITDHSYRFDDIAVGYEGQLYLEVVPLSFSVTVQAGLSLNQLRLTIGDTQLADDALREIHDKTDGLLFREGAKLSDASFATANGLFLSLDLEGDDDNNVGYKAIPTAPGVDLGRVRKHPTDAYWENVVSQQGRIVLEPSRFYLLLSNEAVRIPSTLASEMTAYDPTSGELRTHYAGFFDPGFGFDREGSLLGSRAALEVRAHDVPFMIEHGQRVCKLTFEKMIEEPTVLYGETGSHYQGQLGTLSKHFMRPSRLAKRRRPPNDPQPGLFSDE